MKPWRNQFARSGALGSGALTILTLWLLAAPSGRAQNFTATGSAGQLLAPPMTCTNGLGQVLLPAGAFTVRVDSTEPRCSGRRTVLADGWVQADGSTVISGTAYQEVGTWAGTNFTPSGGLWELSWRGVLRTNYSLEQHETGYGSGGSIDGLRLEETTTRTNASGFFDPAVPFVISGAIKPGPPNGTTAPPAREQAVRVSWPATSSIKYAIQGASSVQGPWELVPDQVLPGMDQLTVPATQPMPCLRLVEAP